MKVRLAKTNERQRLLYQRETTELPMGDDLLNANM